MAHHAFRFAEHHLDKARVLVGFGGECYRPFRGLDARYVDIPALGLGDDLLRHDQHVARFRHQPVRGKRLDGNRPEIVARLDELDAGQRLGGDFAVHFPNLARSSGNTRSA